MQLGWPFPDWGMSICCRGGCRGAFATSMDATSSLRWFKPTFPSCRGSFVALPVPSPKPRRQGLRLCMHKKPQYPCDGDHTSAASRPFVVDRNICNFVWYGGVAGEGLRSVGEEALLSSKSMCSILPIARLLRAGILRGSGFFYDSAFARGALVGGRFIRDSSRRLECPAPAHTEGGGEGGGKKHDDHGVFCRVGNRAGLCGMAVCILGNVRKAG